MADTATGRDAAPSQSITRKTASEINPLIGTLYTEDTLDALAMMVSTLGYLLSEVENPKENTDPSFGNLHLLFGPIAAALRFESENLSPAHIQRQSVEVSHD